MIIAANQQNDRATGATETHESVGLPIPKDLSRPNDMNRKRQQGQERIGIFFEAVLADQGKPVRFAVQSAQDIAAELPPPGGRIGMLLNRSRSRMYGDLVLS